MTLQIFDIFLLFCSEALTSGDPILAKEYNQCVEKLKEFRNVHLQVVAR